MALAACGGNDDGGDTSDEPSSSGGAETATPVSGGTLTFALESETTGGYCIAEAQLAVSGISVHNAVFDPLFAFDEDIVPQPYLAESSTPNADFTTFTIKLRPGITFHDGSALDAEVVKLNLDTERGEPAAIAKTNRRPLLGPVVLSNIASVDVVDDLTVNVNMKTPWVAFPTYMASGRFGIAAEAQLMSPECADLLIGTGPFTLTSWQRNQEMVLERNPNYWRTDAEGRQLPYLDELVFKPIENGVDRYQALQAGTVNAGQWIDQGTIDRLESGEDDLHLVSEGAGYRELSSLLTNVSKPPLDDAEVRRHVSMAIDRQALNDVGHNGGREPANQPFDSEVMGYREDAPDAEYDPETAAEFFAGKDLTVEMVSTIDPTTKAITEDVARQLEAVGVTVIVNIEDQSTAINRALSGGFNLTLARNYPGQDPDSNYVWWHSGQPTNFGRIDDPDLDAALDAGRTGTDPEARRAAYEDVGRILTDEHYVLWNWYDEWGIGATDEVHQVGYYTLPDGSTGAGLSWGWTYWTEVWVDG